MTGSRFRMDLLAPSLRLCFFVLTSASGWLTPQGGRNGPSSSRLTSCLIDSKPLFPSDFNQILVPTLFGSLVSLPLPEQMPVA